VHETTPGWTSASRVHGFGANVGRSQRSMLRSNARSLRGFPPFVPVMKSADTGQRDHPGGAQRLRLHGPGRRRVLHEPQMCPIPVIILDVRCEDPLQMAFVQNDRVVQAVSSYRTDEPFHIRILPRAFSSCEHFFDRQSPHPTPKSGRIDPVPIAQEIRRSRFPGITVAGFTITSGHLHPAQVRERRIQKRRSRRRSRGRLIEFFITANC